jgi:uncharacterized membrane protein YfhO
MLSFTQMVARVILTIFPVAFLKKKVRASVYVIFILRSIPLSP